MINDFTASTPAPAIPTTPSIPCLPIVWRQEKEKTRKKGEEKQKAEGRQQTGGSICLASRLFGP